MFDETTMRLHIDPLLLGALREDITSEDVSTCSILQEAVPGSVDLLVKEDGIICGLQIFARVFTLLDPDTETVFTKKDGDAVRCGEKIGEVHGYMRVLLEGERTALNYLQRMSGIATCTKKTAELLRGTKIRLLDTRKTTPNNRIFEKYAVTVGGGYNHRLGLSDGVLLKDNHISAAGGITKAVALAREHAPFVRRIEVETENLDMVREAVEAGADIIMLDNMDHDTMQKACEIIGGRADIEISGNVTQGSIAGIRDLDVDYISSGALTHSAPILDLSMKHLHPVGGQN